MYTKISLKKLTDTPEVGGKQPSHAIIASDDKYENKVQVGKLWLKSGQFGNFLSGQLDTERDYDGKHYEGYVIITTKEYQELKGKVDTGEVSPSKVEEITF